MPRSMNGPGAPNWMILVGGMVQEPAHGDVEDLTALPGPPSFLRALFKDLCGVDVSQHKKLAAGGGVKEEGVHESRFICGTDETGYEQHKTVFTESSDFPVVVDLKTFGLPGIEMVWHYDLTYQGQLGHCGFRHRHLRARFDSAPAKARFEKIWVKVFDVHPEFGR